MAFLIALSNLSGSDGCLLLSRFKNVSHIRLLVEADDDDQPCATIAHSFNNTREHHMDGRFDHKAEAARVSVTSYLYGIVTHLDVSIWYVVSIVPHQLCQWIGTFICIISQTSSCGYSTRRTIG
jgi:hypothetical protein